MIHESLQFPKYLEQNLNEENYDWILNDDSFLNFWIINDAKQCAILSKYI